MGDQRAQGLGDERRKGQGLKDPAEWSDEPAGRVAAAEDEATRRGEDAAQLRRRCGAGELEDDVVRGGRAGQVVAGVVDDLGGAERADEVHVAGAADPGDPGAERDRDLHGECPDPTGGADDHDLLPVADLAHVT